MDALEDHLVKGLLTPENDPQRAHSISAWDWIISAVYN
jgi:hypothetical protein